MTKNPDYLSRIPVVDEPVVTPLVFPPNSHTPSGFYKLEPDGSGGNKFTLLEVVDLEAKYIRGWLAVQNVFASRIAGCLADEEGAICRELKGGARWKSTPPLPFEM